MYELLNDIKSTHVMQLPFDRTNKRSLGFWKESIKELIDKLEKHYNMSISKDTLKNEIKINNEKRRIYRKIYEIMKNDILPCKGKDIYKILSTADYIFDNKMVLELLNEAYEKITKKEMIFKGKRIVLTGCPLGKSTEKIIDAIEDNGGIVVFFENCTISKEKHTLVDENKDPLDALTEHYLGIPCSCMSPNRERNERLEEAISDYNVDGIIDMRLKFCHTYNVEGYGIEKFVEDELDIPYLGIETDYSQKDSGQLNTRIEAFLEML